MKCYYYEIVRLVGSYERGEMLPDGIVFVGLRAWPVVFWPGYHRIVNRGSIWFPVTYARMVGGISVKIQI